MDNEQFILNFDASAEFNSQYLDMPGARVGGCEVDNNAWLKCVNPKVSLEHTNLRCTGGHIHIGFAEGKDMALCEEVIKAMDVFLGLPSVLLDPDTKRRELYGKAGSFRFAKSYTGCEYRTLSNFWIQSEELMGYVWDNAALAIKYVSEGNTFDDNLYTDVSTAIDLSIPELAMELINKFEIPIIKEKILV